MVEADESDRSLLSLSVEIAVLTNVELDHHATFSTLAELRDCYRSFLARATGVTVVWDGPVLLALAPSGAGVNVVPYDAPDPVLTPAGTTFRWRGEEVRLSVPRGAQRAERHRRAGGGPPGGCRPASVVLLAGGVRRSGKAVRTRRHV